MSGPVENAGRSRFRVGAFEVDTETGELWKGPYKQRLQDKPLQLLVALLQSPGRVITREELRSRLWPGDTFVEFDDNLNHAVRKLREVLGDSADKARFVETLPRCGYRLIAPVEPVPSLPLPIAPLNGRPANNNLPGVLRVVRNGWVVAIVVLFVATASFLWLRAVRPRPSPSGRVMLAMLPLENLTGDREQDFLAESLTQEIITELGRLSPNRLGVIALSSVTQFTRTKKTVRQIGRELGVDYVVEGGVRYVDNRLRLNVQLIRVSDQTQVWGDSYESSLDNLLAVERTMSENTVRSLSIALLPASQERLAARPAVSGEAQEAYLRGRFLVGRRTGDAFKQARAYFQTAVDLEPHYAEAYSGLAVASMFLPAYHVLPHAEGIPAAKRAALKALELDPTLAEARAVLAEIHSEHEWDFANAEREFQQVLRDNTNYATAHQWYAAYLWAMGRFDEGIVEMKRASELAPLSLGTMVDLGRAYYFDRQYDRAIEQYGKVIELDPNFSAAHSMLGMALLEKREYDAAITELRKGMALSDGESIWLAYAYAVAGRREEAQQELGACLRRWNAKYTGAVCMSLAYSGLGDTDQAFAWLEKEFQDHTGTIYMLKAYPYWDSLRSDARYDDLLRRARLPR